MSFSTKYGVPYPHPDLKSPDDLKIMAAFKFKDVMTDPTYLRSQGLKAFDLPEPDATLTYAQNTLAIESAIDRKPPGRYIVQAYDDSGAGGHFAYLNKPRTGLAQLYDPANQGGPHLIGGGDFDGYLTPNRRWEFVNYGRCLQPGGPGHRNNFCQTLAVALSTQDTTNPYPLTRLRSKDPDIAAAARKSLVANKMAEANFEAHYNRVEKRWRNNDMWPDDLGLPNTEFTFDLTQHILTHPATNFRGL